MSKNCLFRYEPRFYVQETGFISEDTATFYYPLNLLASKNQNNRTLTFLEDVYFETLLDRFNQPEFLHSFIHSQIQRIIHHDQKYHTPYYLTLKSYLKKSVIFKQRAMNYKLTVAPYSIVLNK